MNPKEKEYNEDVGVIDVANVMVRHWRIMILVPLVMAIVVGTWTMGQTRMFVVEVSLLPQGGATRLGGGFPVNLVQDLGLGANQEGFGNSPELYVTLLETRTVLRKVAEAEYTVPEADGNRWSGSLIEYFGLSGEPETMPAWQKAVKELRERIDVAIDRNTGLVDFTLAFEDPAMAELVASRLLERLEEVNMQLRRGRAQEENRFIAMRVAEAGAELLAAERALEEFLRQNRQFRDSPELLFEHDRLQRQVAIRQEVYTALLRSQEEARMSAVRDTPLFTVIDPPTEAAKVRPRGTLGRVGAAVGAGILIALMLAFMVDYVRRSRERHDKEIRELERLTKAAWRDLQRPVRWFKM